jgi:hypothetical protein
MVKLSDLRSRRANSSREFCRDVTFYVSTEEVRYRPKMKKRLSLSPRRITLFYVYVQIGERLLRFLGIKLSVSGQP